MSGTHTHRPTVLVDMDGVLVDWAKGYNAALRELCEAAGEPYWIPERRTTWRTPHTTEVQRELAEQAFLTPGLYADLEPLPGAIEAVRAMDEAGLEVFIVTSPEERTRDCAGDKQASVERLLGHDWVRRLVLTKDKTIVRGDVLIDDKPEIKGVMAPVWEQIVFTQPYNEHLTGARRLDSWADWPTVVWDAVTASALRSRR